jgi:putative sigma-54 modulation protein
MHVSITGRHLDVTPALREHVEARLEKLRRFIDPEDVQVTLSAEKYRQRAELQLRDSAGSYHAAEETGDLFTSIDQGFDRIESQVKRLHARIVDEHHGRRAQHAKQSFLSGEPGSDENQFGPY